MAIIKTKHATPIPIQTPIEIYFLLWEKVYGTLYPKVAIFNLKSGLEYSLLFVL
jgi:hypothetical protein